jgi:hypothetical protein
VKFGSTTLFDGTREMYSFWRTKQIAAVHGQKMTIANKALAVVDALDLKASDAEGSGDTITVRRHNLHESSEAIGETFRRRGF